MPVHPPQCAPGLQQTVHHAFHGCLVWEEAMIAMPAIATTAPAMSQCVGVMPSTTHSHTKATAM